MLVYYFLQEHNFGCEFMMKFIFMFSLCNAMHLILKFKKTVFIIRTQVISAFRVSFVALTTDKNNSITINTLAELMMVICSNALNNQRVM